jgi:hypothetical protein
VVEHDPVGVVDDLGLVAELDRVADAALADRPSIRIVQADQPARPVRHPTSQPSVGLIEEPLGPLDRGLKFVHQRSEPTGGPGAATGLSPAGVGHDPAGVGELRLGQASDLPGDLEHDLLGCSVRGRMARATSWARRRAARRRSRTRLRVAPPAACTRLAVAASLSTARANSPRSVG